MHLESYLNIVQSVNNRFNGNKYVQYVRAWAAVCLNNAHLWLRNIKNLVNQTNRETNSICYPLISSGHTYIHIYYVGTDICTSINDVEHLMDASQCSVVDVYTYTMICHSWHLCASVYLFISSPMAPRYSQTRNQEYAFAS